MLDVEIVAVVIQPAQPAHERSILYFSLHNELKQLVSKLVYLYTLCLQFDHDWLFSRRQLIVLIVGDLFTQESITWRQAHHQHVVFVSVLNELLRKLTMKDLYHAADHLPDLIIEEGLTFEVEPYEFYRIRVVRSANFKGFCADVAVLTCVHFYHVALGGHLVRFDLLCVVVIFFRSAE